MKSRAISSAVCGLCLGLVLPFAALAQVNVATWHNDLSRTGVNSNETVLTPANVSANGSFGEKFSVTVDGTITAQPLYVSALTIAGSSHNVVFVATEHDSVYAIDADTGAILWKRSFLGSGMTAVSSTLENCTDITPEIGITGTPVIDTDTNTLYAVAATMPGPIQQLHAIDLLTGDDKFGGPVTISASVPGTGDGSSGGTVAFDPESENQRSALSLANGHVVIGWGSHCDHDTFHGWLMSYNASTLSQETVLNTAPNGTDGGVWMAGAAPAVDANGNIFFSSGNGDFGQYANDEFGDSMLRMPPPATGTSWLPVDGFTPWNQNFFDVHNEDMGGGGVVLLPNLPSGAAHQQLAVQATKSGEIVLVDRNDMGHYCTTCSTNGTDTNIVQEIQSQLGGPMLGTPAYWNGTLYFGAPAGPLKAFSFNTATGAISTTPTQLGTYTFGPLPATPSVSSNGNADGIVWVLDSSNASAEVLLAYDATNLSNVLYQYTMNSQGPHFAVPTIANGMVYAGSKTALTAFGLLNAPAVLTITASNVSVPQGQPIPALTGYTATGFVNGQNSSILSGAPDETTTATQNSPVGNYPIDITQGTLTAPDYTFDFVNGTLTITGAQSQTITFNSLPNVTYGAAAITLTATASSGLPVSYAVTGPATLSGSTLTITGVGTVNVTASQAGNSTYNPATPVSRSFTVAAAPLTITASNVSVPQGQPIPALTGYTATGFVNGQNSSILSGAPDETTTATQNSPVGNYPIDITQGTLAAANYTFDFVNGTLTITGAQSQTLTFNSLPNATYGAAAITLTATASSGLPVSYAVTGPATLSGSTLTIAGVGTVTVTASQAGNSTYNPATPVSRSFTVSAAPLTVTAASISVPHGQPIPALTGYTATGFVNGQNSSVLSGTPSETTTATQNSPVGTYPIDITQGTLAAANYTFDFVNGTLTITGAQSQTLTFNALPNATYGTSAITLTATASSGLPVSYAATGPATLSGSMLTITGVGTITVTASQAGNSTYNPATPVSRSFTVSAAPLTITAASVTVPYEQPIPALTGYTATGFVNGQNSSVLSGTPAESTTATDGSAVGKYPITITGGTLAAANYTFVFVSGTLTISSTSTTPPVTLTFAQNPVAANTPFSYTVVVGSGTAGQPNPVGTITLFGYLPSGQLIQADGPHPIGTTGTAGVSTFSGTISPGVPAGQYRVYATFTPASGSTYTTANSPQVTETAEYVTVSPAK